MAFRVGVIGGTFNPIHFGHLRVGVEVLEQTGLDQIMYMPNYMPPHRDAPTVSAQDRFMMCKLAVQGYPQFTVSDLEIRQGRLSYTIDTMRLLVEEHPDYAFSFITGSDSLVRFVWHKFDEILDYLECFYVMNRPGVNLAQLKAKLDEMHLRNYNKIFWVDAPGLDISSTYIRSILADGRTAKFLVPDSVLDYIRIRNLFKE